MNLIFQIMHASLYDWDQCLEFFAHAVSQQVLALLFLLGTHSNLGLLRDPRQKLISPDSTLPLARSLAKILA